MLEAPMFSTLLHTSLRKHALVVDDDDHHHHHHHHHHRGFRYVKRKGDLVT